MSTFSVPLGIGPNAILSPFTDRSKALNPSIRRTQLGYLSISNHGFCTRGRLGVARFGLGQVPFPDPDGAEGIIRDLLRGAEMFMYTVADAAVSASSDALADTNTTTKQSDWLSGITNGMETVLKVLKGGLSALHVPYSYGFAIILLTFLVKAATFPLTKKQVESTTAMRSLAPQIKAIQERYAGDQERIQLETARLYKLAGINPLAGCLPTLATIPIWIGLYRALSNVANEGLLTEGFFWIPSLSGPTTTAGRQTGSGISWLFQFVDGHPPLGWNDTFLYLVLPVLLVITQYISVQIMQPPQSNDPNLKTSQAITKFLPLMIGYFALSVPSGLSLYWLTNNILSTVQQVYLQKLGGAENRMKQFNDDIVKKELSQIQKSILEATVKSGMDRGEKLTSETKMDRGEKLTSEGLRPGERFKQLKEEEARRRRQREEEKRKDEEGKVEFELNNGEQRSEVNLVEEPRNGIDESVNHKSNPSSYEQRTVNGATSSRAQEHVKIADHSSSYENDRIDKESSGMTDKDRALDEEVTANVGRDDKYSGKDENTK